ncbi:lysophospholipid acyltransferase family protein [Sediminicoccus sp. KRV36]|uniref:lysophospholipid acyltransferase family protein n=1 Tax=Sediminicoccus sp. KRV36 TaxID=3133721 RepID=UPI00200F96F2|nr:lysophospholipid acyltransferase family protein [Sediminicoccus rosea]UPY37598.1 1-acyl-sn-glycerol-3-phosphate acyltransferase [Sediminicoccus rosea]
MASDPPAADGAPQRDPAEAAARRRPLRWAWDSFSFVLVLTLLAICFAGWSLIATLLVHLLPRRFGQRLGQAATIMFFSFFLWVMRRLGIARVDLSALAAVQDFRGVVFAANHLALLDILLLGSCLPRTVCIIKASLWRNPLLGGGRLAGYIRNDEPLRLIRNAAAALREGSNLLIFPEGTRQPAGRMGAFRPGFALIARRAQAPVQTLFIESNSPYLRKGWPLWKRPEFPLEYRVTLGPLLPVEGRAEDFSEALRELFLARLQPPADSP